ncbi:MAG TPA: hypothetical protein VMU64_00970 [Acidimicrobiales bacterium]|nr:hypothetical protein [Acidimicrobiales bacterium]
MKRTLMLLVMAALVVGLVAAEAGVASARGHGHRGRPTATAASGTATCSVKAVLTFNPPLQANATGDSTVILHAQLVKCSATSAHGRTTGHIAAGLGTIPTDTCSAASAAPSFSVVGMRWTPPSRVASSTLSATSSGTVTTLGNGKAEVSYSDLTVTGSFATSTGTATLDSRDTVSNLGSACSGSGLDAIAFGGVASL